LIFLTGPTILLAVLTVNTRSVFFFFHTLCPFPFRSSWSDAYALVNLAHCFRFGTEILLIAKSWFSVLSVYFCIWKVFLKKIKIFYFFKLIFLCVFKLFWCADIKNNFLKNKKNYFNTFLSEKHFKKQPQPHSQTYLIQLLIYIFSPIIWGNTVKGKEVF
jgi:hypothetical protein